MHLKPRASFRFMCIFRFVLADKIVDKDRIRFINQTDQINGKSGDCLQSYSVIWLVFVRAFYFASNDSCSFLVVWSTIAQNSRYDNIQTDDMDSGVVKN